MFPLPSPPDTLVVRQLTCVSCREKFTIAEDYAHANGEPSQHWRLSPDSSPDTELRYEPDRTRRHVTPQARSAPNMPAKAILNWERSQRSHLNCPRCGADNRNWLNLLSLKDNGSRDSSKNAQTWSKKVQGFWQNETRLVEKLLIIIFMSITLIMSGVALTAVPVEMTVWLFAIGSVGVMFVWRTRTSNYRLWRQRFPAAHVGVILAIFLAVIACVTAVAFSVPTGKILLMAFFVIFSAVGILFSLTSPWIKLRENQYLRQVAAKATNLERTLWIRGFLSIVIFSTILPLLFFRLLPIGVSAIAERLQQSSETEITTTVDLDEGPGEIVIDGTNPAYLTKRQEAIDRAVEMVGADTRLMGLWVITVGLSSFSAVLTGMFALKNFVVEIDAQIPPPIYHSLANMTRVTVWEAKQALEVSGNMGHIQWTRVARNDDGGIKLVGVHVTETAVDHQGRPQEKYTPAQEYAITADAWARIVKAKINRTRVFVTATPESQIGEAFFKQVPQSEAAVVRSS